MKTLTLKQLIKKANNLAKVLEDLSTLGDFKQTYVFHWNDNMGCIDCDKDGEFYSDNIDAVLERIAYEILSTTVDSYNAYDIGNEFQENETAVEFFQALESQIKYIRHQPDHIVMFFDFDSCFEKAEMSTTSYEGINERLEYFKED